MRRGAGSGQVQQQSVAQKYVLGDLLFAGMDGYTKPFRLPPGSQQSIVNLLPSGNGSLRLRNGFRGQFTAPLGGPIYAAIGLRTSGATKIVFVAREAGDATGPGRLFVTTVGSATYTELLDAQNSNARFAFSNGGRGCRMAIHGDYAYVCPGEYEGSGTRTRRLVRYNGTIAETTLGLSSPAQADISGTLVDVRPGVTLTSAVIERGDLLTIYQPQAVAYSAPAELITYANGEDQVAPIDLQDYGGGSGATTSYWGDDWTGHPPGSPDVQMLLAGSLNGNQFFELDGDNSGTSGSEAAEYVMLRTPQSALNAEYPYPSKASQDHSKLFVLSLNAWVENSDSIGRRVEAQVIGRSGGSDLASGPDPQYGTGLSATAVAQMRFLFDFRSFADIDSYRVRFGSPDAITVGDYRNYLAVNGLSLKIPGQYFATSTSGSSLVIRQGYVQVWEEQLLTAGLVIDGATLATRDYSAKSNLFLNLVAATGVEGLRIKGRVICTPIGGGSDTVYETSELLAEDGGYTIDLSEITAAGGDISLVKRVGFEILSDLDVAGIVEGGSATILTWNSIDDPGNLTASSDVAYLFTEIQMKAGESVFSPQSDFFESSGTMLSDTVTPAAGTRRTSVVLDRPLVSGVGPTLPINTAATHYGIYRYSSVFPDQPVRRVAVVRVGADDTDPNGFWTWDYATKTLVDSTPDTALFYEAVSGVGHIYQSGQDPMPEDVLDIVEQGDRLFASAGTNVYTSWLRDPDHPWPLYTTFTAEDNDPSLPIKGYTFGFPGPLGKRLITGLLAYGTTVLVWTDQSTHLVTGNNPTNFASQNLDRTGSRGCIAHGSPAMAGEAGAWFLSSAGVMAVVGEDVRRVSAPLENLIAPQKADGGAFTDPDDLQYAHGVFSNERYWLFAPVAGGSALTVAWIFDRRTNGWFKATLPVSMVSAVSVAGASDTDDLYTGGSDGQLYLYYGFSDKATPAGAASAIAWSVLTRAHGQASAEGKARYGVNRFQECSIDIETGAADMDIAVTIYCKGAQRAVNWTLPANERKQIDLRNFGLLRGTTHWMGLTGSASEAIEVHGYQINASEASAQRR